MSNQLPVVIVGAGVTGLCCALDLKAAGIPVCVLEKEDAPGGRVRTDTVEGFRLDRGFQVWLEAYPECRKRLDPAALGAGAFGSGAVIFNGRGLRLFADPFRHPGQLWNSLGHPVGTLADKLRLQRLRLQLAGREESDLLSGEEMSTLAFWQAQGFSPRMVEGFLAPFFRGIFLADPAEVSRRMFAFVFAMFGRGRALLPAGGMQAIPEALAKDLRPEELWLSTPVVSVEADEVRILEGDKIRASAVVVTLPEPERIGLPPRADALPPRRVSTLYFDAARAPVKGPWLVLNGTAGGCVNQLSVNSSVAAGYAPEGRELIAVSLKRTCSEAEVKEELRQWFGPEVADWRLLRQMDIPCALPAFAADRLPGPGWAQVQGIFYAGDGWHHPSLQGAMASGAAVAAEIIRRHRRT